MNCINFFLELTCVRVFNYCAASEGLGCTLVCLANLQVTVTVTVAIYVNE